jgi:transposase
MIYVGIDVASDKHDCCILDGNGSVLRENFTIKNNREGFDELIRTVTSYLLGKRYSDARIGLESTGHYSVNLTNFLKAEGLEVTIFNPLHVNLYRKAQTLRKTKTDKTDARFLAIMLFSDDSKPYTPVSYQISELKALVRHRFRLISLRSRLKVSVSRTVTIIFPELQSAVWSIHQTSCYALLLEFPTAKQIAFCHLTHLTNLLTEHSHGKYGREKALEIRTLAEKSIGLNSRSVGFELQQTIRLIQNLQQEVLILDKQIKDVMKEINFPILTVPGISYTLGAIILAEIGDITRFQNPAKLLAFAGLEPSTYQSGKFTAGNTPMVKRGSTYLRWAFLNAARLVSMRDDTFKTYCRKKKAEGKHHNVVMSHVGKKLVRVVFHILKTNTSFVPLS